MIAILFVFLFVGFAHADYNILYDTTTMHVKEYGYQVKYPVPSNLAWGTIKEDDSILKENNIRDILYNPVTKQAQKREQSEISARINKDLKENLQKQMFEKQQELDYQLWKISKGFEVTQSTVTLQSQIDDLETQIKIP